LQQGRGALATSVDRQDGSGGKKQLIINRKRAHLCNAPRSNSKKGNNYLKQHFWCARTNSAAFPIKLFSQHVWLFPNLYAHERKTQVRPS
jgi:hypothetical protein